MKAFLCVKAKFISWTEVQNQSRICWIVSSKLQGKSNTKAEWSLATRKVVLIAKRFKKISLFIAKLWPSMQVSYNCSHCSLLFNKVKKGLTWIYDCKLFSAQLPAVLCNPAFTSADKWQGSQNSIYFTATFNFLSWQFFFREIYFSFPQVWFKNWKKSASK